MTTLRLFTQIGKNVQTCVFQPKKRPQNIACAISSWNSRNRGTYSNFSQPSFQPLLEKQLLLAAFPLPRSYILTQVRHISNKVSPDHAGKTESKSSAAITNDELFAESSKLGLFAKFKLMYKKYWYVLIPVHIVTSIGWFGGFYYLSQSGVDIASLLHTLHVSETIIDKMQNSSMGHLAIAYLCYKVATPLRYAVTLGGTTVSIKHLVQAGYIKPIPTKQELMNMYEQKKANMTGPKEKRGEDK